MSFSTLFSPEKDSVPSGYNALDCESVISYLSTAVPRTMVPARGTPRVEEIREGNLNSIFRIIYEDGGDGCFSLVIKQALPYMRRVGKGWPLTVKRGVIEGRALKIFYEIYPEAVPRVYHIDEEMCLIIMEDLSPRRILRRDLIDGRMCPHLPVHIGRFLAKNFLAACLSITPSERRWAAHNLFNPRLCRITEDLVFTNPYIEGGWGNRGDEALNEEIKRLRSDEELQAEVLDLKEKFITCSESLIHGDLHTGSILADEKSVKIIDAEFACYGPVGYDLGNVMGHLF